MDVNIQKQYRWILVMQHAMEELFRTVDDKWYDTLQECKQAAEALEFEFCCGYNFEFESRPAPSIESWVYTC